MGGQGTTEDRTEVLVLVRADSGAEFEAVLQAIERGGGRVLHAVPPVSAMAFVTAASIADLRAHPAVELVAAEPIADERRERASQAAAEAMWVWNEHLRSRQRRPGAAAEPRSWDSAGRLPPDPPRRVLEELRRRERDLASQGEDPPRPDGRSRPPRT